MILFEIVSFSMAQYSLRNYLVTILQKHMMHNANVLFSQVQINTFIGQVSTHL